MTDPSTLTGDALNEAPPTLRIIGSRLHRLLSEHGDVSELHATVWGPREAKIGRCAVAFFEAWLQDKEAAARAAAGGVQ